MMDDYKTKCPKCDEAALVVMSATLCSTGKKIYPRAPLCDDGFAFDIPPEANQKDGSTEDEVVNCAACGTVFDLGMLMNE